MVVDTVVHVPVFDEDVCDVVRGDGLDAVDGEVDNVLDVFDEDVVNVVDVFDEDVSVFDVFGENVVEVSVWNVVHVFGEDVEVAVDDLVHEVGVDVELAVDDAVHIVGEDAVDFVVNNVDNFIVVGGDDFLSKITDISTIWLQRTVYAVSNSP